MQLTSWTNKRHFQLCNGTSIFNTLAKITLLCKDPLVKWATLQLVDNLELVSKSMDQLLDKVVLQRTLLTSGMVKSIQKLMLLSGSLTLEMQTKDTEKPFSTQTTQSWVLLLVITPAKIPIWWNVLTLLVVISPLQVLQLHHFLSWLSNLGLSQVKLQTHAVILVTIDSRLLILMLLTLNACACLDLEVVMERLSTDTNNWSFFFELKIIIKSI